MPVNKGFMIRIYVYDKCFVQRDKKWDKKLILEEVNDELFKRQLGRSISKETFQKDKRDLANGVLGFEVKIVIYENKYYRYADDKFALPNIFLDIDEFDAIYAMKPILNQFNKLGLLENTQELFEKLERVNKVDYHDEIQIQFDNTEEVTGTEYLKEIYNAIRKKKALDIIYTPFDKPKEKIKGFSPYQLKQNKHRWLAVGWYKNRLLLVGLERIKNMYVSDEKYIPCTVNIDEHFAPFIGVSQPIDGNSEPTKIRLLFSKTSVPYIRTKKLHKSQITISDKINTLEVELNVIISIELTRMIASYGSHVEVLSPGLLRQRIIGELQDNINQYK